MMRISKVPVSTIRKTIDTIMQSADPVSAIAERLSTTKGSHHRSVMGSLLGEDISFAALFVAAPQGTRDGVLRAWALLRHPDLVWAFRSFKGKAAVGNTLGLRGRPLDVAIQWHGLTTAPYAAPLVALELRDQGMPVVDVRASHSRHLFPSEVWSSACSRQRDLDPWGYVLRFAKGHPLEAKIRELEIMRWTQQELRILEDLKSEPVSIAISPSGEPRVVLGRGSLTESDFRRLVHRGRVRVKVSDMGKGWTSRRFLLSMRRPTT